jgi:AraC family transcriptional regulator
MTGLYRLPLPRLYMNYIEIINDAIQFIESNLHRKLELEELSSRYYISPMHFYRIFRAVTNQTVKSYILGRKLTEAAVSLRNTDRRVIDIAFGYGFSSHELFTRNFQKMFQIAPSRYRVEKITVAFTEKMDIVERSFKNKNKDLLLDHSCREIKEIRLLGKEMLFCPEISCQMEEAMGKVLNFAQEYIEGTARQLYSIIRSHADDPSRYYCFYGIAAGDYRGSRSGLSTGIIPGARYAVFRYPGNMGLVFDTVREDLYRLISQTGLKLNEDTGIDMFDLFPGNYKETGKFYIHVPVL